MSAYAANVVTTCASYTPSVVSPAWTDLPGKSIYQMESISGILYGVSDMGVFFASAGVTSNPGWTSLGGGWKKMTVDSNLRVFGLDSGGNLSSSVTIANPTGYTGLPGLFLNIHVCNGVFVGITTVGSIVYADQNVASSPNYTTIAGPSLIQIVIDGSGNVYGVDTFGAVWFGGKYKSPIWVKLPSQLYFRQIMVRS